MSFLMISGLSELLLIKIPEFFLEYTGSVYFGNSITQSISPQPSVGKVYFSLLLEMV